MPSPPPRAEAEAEERPAAPHARSRSRSPRRSRSRSPAPRKPKHEPKAAPGLRLDFATALAAHPQAKAVLDGFSPSAQRDYLEWIGEAKQDATRAKRIATAIEWLSDGKKRHWKYQNC